MYNLGGIMNRLFAFALTCLFSASVFAGQLDSLSWMTGSWSGVSTEGTYQETISPADGGVILSFTKFLDPSGALMFSEFTQIKEENGQVIMTSMPVGMPSVSFT